MRLLCGLATDLEAPIYVLHGLIEAQRSIIVCNKSISSLVLEPELCFCLGLVLKHAEIITYAHSEV